MVKGVLEALVNLPGFSAGVKVDKDCGIEVTLKSPSHWAPLGADGDQSLDWLPTRTIPGIDCLAHSQTIPVDAAWNTPLREEAEPLAVQVN